MKKSAALITKIKLIHEQIEIFAKIFSLNYIIIFAIQ